MESSETAITVEHIGKRYRIGQQEEQYDSISRMLFSFIKSPIKNYQKYRSLYRFDDAVNDPDVEVDGIVWALKDVSFNVRQGEIMGIIGSNGAGKSTLLKILCRITNPSRGYAQIKGRISSLLEVGTGFHPELSGRDNVYLNGTILGMKRQEIKKKFDEIVDFSGVEKFIDTPVKRYSSGMKVRLAFSVAAHLEPELLIIDEVLAVGDADFQNKCLTKMERVGEQGRTVLFVSHNMEAVSRLCNRAIFLDDGKVANEGPAAKVVSAYLNSELGTSANKQWDDPKRAPAGPVVRLRAVRAKTEDGQLSDTFDIRSPIKLEMEYEVLCNDFILLPHFSINNGFGQCSFITIDQDSQWRRRKRPIGRYISTAWIPGNLLSEGRTFISCNCLTLNPDIVQFIEKNAVSFQVVDSFEGDSSRGDYSKDIAGAVRPLLKWTTETINLS